MTFSREQLVAAAGVDPWNLLGKLHSGDPAQIDALAAAFYKAGGHLTDAHNATVQSQNYVRAGYTVQGSSPLDVNAEAAKTKAHIANGATHLPQIAKILTTVATHLGQATTTAATEVTHLQSGLHKIENDYLHFMQSTGHHLPPDDQASIRQGYLDDAVSTVKTHGATVNTLLTAYENTLGTSLKSMADLGYLPPDAVDEGPGDVNISDATRDAQNTINAAKNPNKKAGLAQYDLATQTLDLINRTIKANGGHVSDAQYSYLWQYYNQTAPHSADIFHLLQGTPAADLHRRGALFADGLLNLSSGAEQPTDAGHQPYDVGRFGPHLPQEPLGRQGLGGLPPAVLDILNSDIGKVQPSPQFGGGTDTPTPMLRRAEWKDGHWVVDNYATDTSFSQLLNLADPGVQGGNGFSKSLAEAGVRWKQDENAVEHNTSAWLDAAHLYYSYPGVSSSDSAAQTLGFPPDTDPAHLHLNLNDDGASAALAVAARNSYASADVLNNAADRHAILGLNWHDGTGAGDVIASGTAPDPKNSQLDPATGKSIRNEAALAVMKDTGSDYDHFVARASDPVKNALTNLAITHLDSFATVPEGSAPSRVDQLVLPGGQHVDGVNLNQNDAANFLKMIATTGPGRYGALHAAALQQGALWIHQAPGTGSNSGGNYASILDGRVSAAGFAAANDLAQSANAADRKEYAAQIAEQQDEATKDLVGKIAFQTVGAGLDLATFGASDHVKSALESFGTLNGILKDAHEDYGAFNANDPNTQYLQHLQDQMQHALGAPHDQAQVTNGVSQDQAWMALRAAAMDPTHSAALNRAVDPNGNPYLPPGVLQGANGGPASSTVDTGDPHYLYLTGDAGKRDLIDPLLDHTFGGAGNRDAWGAEGINATLGGTATERPVNWTDGPILAETSVGGNKIYIWMPGRDPNTWEFEDPQDITPH